MSPTPYDALVLGAGGAGLMCAIQAGRRGRKVLVLDHSEKVGGKILISGGGRCNFTNTGTSSENFQSANPFFAKSALARFTPHDFMQMLNDHKVAYHEKKLGQLFCDHSARDVVEMLKAECEKSKVKIQLKTKIESVKKENEKFTLKTDQGSFESKSLVIATGGLSIPKIGASGFGYEIARQFGLAIVETAPALDGFIFTDPAFKTFSELSGLSIDCVMSVNGLSFRENLLFTHLGISGPAALQASLHWRPGHSISIDLLPDQKFLEIAQGLKISNPKLTLIKWIKENLPARFAEVYCEKYLSQSSKTFGEISESELRSIGESLHSWNLKPSSTVGYGKAEVTRGGVNTDELSSKTLESKKIPGLYFIGEVVDVTGWLGGYNFQWAWASGWAAAQNLAG